MFLKTFAYPESDITDSKLQHLLRVLVESSGIFLKFTYDDGKITQNFRVKLKKDGRLRYGSNDVSRFPYITGIG